MIMRITVRTLALLCLAFLSVALFYDTGPARAQFSAAEAPAEMRARAQTVIDGQIRAFRAERHEEAFSYAAPGIRSVFGSTNRFIKMVKKGYRPIYDARDWQFGRSRMKGADLFQEIALTGPDGRQWVALYTLRQQANGAWKITGVQIKKSLAQPT